MNNIIPIIPVDPSELPPILEAGVPAPTIEHTLVDCEACGRGGWIGPQQKKARDAGLGEALCYYCLFEAMGTDSLKNARIIALNPGADDLPRRI